MKENFIIVEGPSDVVILKEILKLTLSEEIYKFHFVEAGVYYNAITSVRPILDLVSLDSKVLLVFDADTTDPRRVQERRDFVKDHLSYVSHPTNFKFFVFTPNIDVEIRPISELSILKRKNRSEYNEKVHRTIRENIDSIVTIPVIKSIIDFIK